MAFSAYETAHVHPRGLVLRGWQGPLLFVVSGLFFLAMVTVARPELRFGFGLTGGILAVVTLMLLLRAKMRQRQSSAVSRALGAMIARGPNTQLLGPVRTKWVQNGKIFRRAVLPV